MRRGHLLPWCILLITIVKYSSSFEVFLKNSITDEDQTSEPWINAVNKSYEIPLFQKRYITIRTQPEDIRSTRFNRSVVGFKFQVSSSNAAVADIQKELVPSTMLTKSTKTSAVLLEDLYIGEYWFAEKSCSVSI